MYYISVKRKDDIMASRNNHIGTVKGKNNPTKQRANTQVKGGTAVIPAGKNSINRTVKDNNIKGAVKNKVKEKRKPLAAIDIPFFVVVIILISFGLIMMFSASYAKAYTEYGGDSFAYIRKQIVFAVIGIVGMLIISFIDYHVLQNKKLVFLLLGVSLLMMLYCHFFGTIVNGARRWIYIGSQGFQPSEIMKFAMITFFSFIIAKNYDKMKKLTYGVAPFVTLLGIIAFFMMNQPHLSGTIIMMMVGFVMMFVGGTRGKHLFIMTISGVVGLIGVVIYLITQKGASYFENRINGFFNPMRDIKGDTYQTYQSLVTIGSGGLFGLGLGNSRQKYFYLPEAQNDFVFSVVCEELGFIGAMIIILLFVLFIFRGFYIASMSPDKFGMMLCVGLTAQIGIQALLNIAVVTNTIPNTGISLPFFSYGGTALIMQLLQMGVILNISRYAALE